jgi:hypothetical protein
MDLQKPHFTEADLLETYYMQPGASMPVMMHLAACSECAERYERLERKIRGLAECEHDMPETFWARQRMAIMRRIDAHGPRSFSMARVMRVAAAAVLALSLGAVVTWKTLQVDDSAIRRVDTAPTITAAATTDESAARPLDELVSPDPWQSDELNDFHTIVAWESWVDPGDESL